MDSFVDLTQKYQDRYNGVEGKSRRDTADLMVFVHLIAKIISESLGQENTSSVWDTCVRDKVFRRASKQVKEAQTDAVRMVRQHLVDCDVLSHEDDASRDQDILAGIDALLQAERSVHITNIGSRRAHLLRIVEDILRAQGLDIDHEN